MCSNSNQTIFVLALLIITVFVFVWMYMPVDLRTNYRVELPERRISQAIVSSNLTKNVSDTKSINSDNNSTPNHHVTFKDRCQKTKRKAVIIYAATRSGSTFLGEFFNQHSEVYYLFEPLHNVGLGMKNRSEMRQAIMKGLFYCNYTHVQEIYKDNPNDEWFMCRSNICFQSRSKFLWRNTQLCNRDSRYCGVKRFDPRTLEKICQQSLFTAVKIVSLSTLKDFIPLLNESGLDLKVIHLVRDPRAVVPSQLKMLQGSANQTRAVAKRLCTQYYNDWRYHTTCILEGNTNSTLNAESAYCDPTTRQLWKGHYMRLSHEFVSEDPLRALSKIYEFVGLNYDENVADWLRASTTNATTQGQPKNKELTTGFYGTIRDSKKLILKWRHTQSIKTVRSIQDLCKQSMRALGYIPVYTSQALKNISVNLYSSLHSYHMP